MDIHGDEIDMRQLRAGEELPWALLLLADETTEAIEKYVYSSDIWVVTLNMSPTLIGVMVLVPAGQGQLEIKNIAVATEWQGKGIGAQMITKAKHVAATGGYIELLVGTADCGYKEISFYLNCGFKICGKRQNFFIDNYPQPIYENGVQLKDMVLLSMIL